MTALKNVGQMTALLGRSALSRSPLWEKPVGQIHLTQLHAFVARQATAGQKDTAETIVQICLNEVVKAVARDEIPVPAMMSYSAPKRSLMTAGELRDGLALMGREKGAAVLFALETELDATGVGYLTWTTAMRLYRAATLSPLAIACTRVCPRQLHLQYVFWTRFDGLDVPSPLLNLDQDVFDAFGLVWAELAESYDHLIMVDGPADLESVKALLSR